MTPPGGLSLAQDLPNFALEHPSSVLNQEPPSPRFRGSREGATFMSRNAAAAFLRGDVSRERVVDLFRLSFPEARSERDLAIQAERVLGLDMRSIQRVLRKEQDLKARYVFALMALAGVEAALSKIFGDHP